MPWEVEGPITLPSQLPGFDTGDSLCCIEVFAKPKEDSEGKKLLQGVLDDNASATIGNTSGTPTGSGAVRGEPTATTGQAIAATTAGLAVGAGAAYGTAYALGAISAFCTPCAVAIGVGLAVLTVYNLIDGGAKDLYHSSARIVTGAGTTRDFFVIGTTIGGIAGGSQGKAAFGNGQSRMSSYLAGRAGRNAADIAFASGQTRGAGVGMNAGGKTVSAASGDYTDLPQSKEVTAALMSTPAEIRLKAPWHGGCGEIGCLDKLFAMGINPRGGTSRAFNIGMSGEGHGTPKPACPSCQYVLELLGVKSK